jgi:maleate cis-trans isomerase
VADVVAFAHPQFTAVTGDLIQAAMGVEWDRALRASISDVAGTAATTAMTAVTDAFDFLGARRVSVASPFRDEQNAYIRRYLEEAGFEVLSVGGYPTHSIREVRDLPPDAPLTRGKSVYEADPSTQALFVACPVWDVNPYIAQLEDSCGVPVLTVMNTFLWSGLSALKHPGGVHGYGRLLERVLA